MIVATYAYDHEGLTRLRAPERDVDALIDVLVDPDIGDFEVKAVVNQPAHEITVAVAQFFADRRADDLLLLHFSCHGVKDDSGELYLAAQNTRLDLLDATAVSSAFVRRAMDRTRAGRIVLLLDCCYAGAFGRGMITRAGGAVDIADRLGGRGRAVIAATSALEFAFDGIDLADGDPDATQPSVFTRTLVEGLRTGEADRDQDGWVSLDELYAYVHDEVRRINPHQNPKKWALDVEGDFHVARRGAPVTTPSTLPAPIVESINSLAWWERKSAVEPLVELLAGAHPGLALGARVALENLAVDPDDRVKAAARAYSSQKDGILAVTDNSTIPAMHLRDADPPRDVMDNEQTLLRETASSHAWVARLIAVVIVLLAGISFSVFAAPMIGGAPRRDVPNATESSRGPSQEPSRSIPSVECWDGKSVENASACELPKGRPGFASAFPSLDNRCHPRSSAVEGKLEVFVCNYGSYVFRYSRWNPTFDRIEYYRLVNPRAAEDDWLIEGERSGRTWTSLEPGGRESHPYQWSATYNDLPYSVSVEGVTESARAQGVERLRVKAPDSFTLQ